MMKIYEKIMNGANVSLSTANKLDDWFSAQINEAANSDDWDKVDEYQDMQNELRFMFNL